MAVEIGTLVVKGAFGSPGEKSDETERMIDGKIARLERDMMRRVEQMILEAERRASER